MLKVFILPILFIWACSRVYFGTIEYMIHDKLQPCNDYGYTIVWQSKNEYLLDSNWQIFRKAR